VKSGNWVGGLNQASHVYGVVSILNYPINSARQLKLTMCSTHQGNDQSYAIWVEDPAAGACRLDFTLAAPASSSPGTLHGPDNYSCLFSGGLNRGAVARI